MDFIYETPVTIFLIAANVIISLIGFSNAGFVDKAILWPYRMKREKQFYRMITSGFLHADFVHLFFNMFTLFFFGRAIELYFSIYGLGGQIAYLALYFTALIVSDISSYIKYKDDYHYRALGASGAVCAVVFAAIIFNPWGAIYLYGALKISATVYAILFVVYCVYMGKKGQDNINHDAHLWGAIYGLAFTLVLIGALRPELLDAVMNEFLQPSIFGK